MIVTGQITPEVLVLGIPLYPEKVSDFRFHVAFDGINWQCFQNEEGDKTNDLTKTPMNVKFSADWDGVSDGLENIVGSIPEIGIPFMGWPQKEKQI